MDDRTTAGSFRTEHRMRTVREAAAKKQYKRQQSESKAQQRDRANVENERRGGRGCAGAGRDESVFEGKDVSCEQASRRRGRTRPDPRGLEATGGARVWSSAAPVWKPVDRGLRSGHGHHPPELRSSGPCTITSRSRLNVRYSSAVHLRIRTHRSHLTPGVPINLCFVRPVRRRWFLF